MKNNYLTSKVFMGIFILFNIVVFLTQAYNTYNLNGGLFYFVFYLLVPVLFALFFIIFIDKNEHSPIIILTILFLVSTIITSFQSIYVTFTYIHFDPSFINYLIGIFFRIIPLIALLVVFLLDAIKPASFKFLGIPVTILYLLATVFFAFTRLFFYYQFISASFSSFITSISLGIALLFYFVQSPDNVNVHHNIRNSPNDNTYFQKKEYLVSNNHTEQDTTVLLNKLDKLRENGIITDLEYHTKKTELLKK